MVERLESVRLGGFFELWLWCASNHPVADRKDLGTCDALLCMSHEMQSVWDSGKEARIVQINFSATFDRVIIKEFSKSSVLWLLEDSVLSILYMNSPRTVTSARLVSGVTFGR